MLFIYLHLKSDCKIEIQCTSMNLTKMKIFSFLHFRANTLIQVTINAIINISKRSITIEINISYKRYNCVF